MTAIYRSGKTNRVTSVVAFAVLTLSVCANSRCQEITTTGTSEGDFGSWASVSASSGSATVYLTISMSEDDDLGILSSDYRWRGGTRKWAYLCIVKSHNVNEEQDQFPSRVEAKNGTISVDQTAHLSVGSLQFEYRSNLNEKTPQESLTLNGEAVDLAQGRVLYVDMSNIPVVVQQISYNPAPIPYGKASIEVLAKQIWRKDVADILKDPKERVISLDVVVRPAKEEVVVPTENSIR